MAFDQPLEADRIDDFNLISAFVRAPLWLLSGFLGSKKTNNDDDDDIVRSPRLDDDHSNSCSSSHEHHSSPRGVTSLSPSTNRSLPRRETSPWDAAVFHQRTTCCDDPSMVSDFSAAASTDTGEASTDTGGLKRNKKLTKNLSWSDQSGQRLCEYANESMLHEPPTTPLASTTMGSPVANAKPVRSVLRRSKSVQSENSNMLDNISKDANSTRYIPQMNQNKNGLMMPTRPYGSDLSGNGGESQSPQWGWYTNLTPPSPEMYQSHPARKTPSKKENASNVPHNLQKGLQSCVSAEAKPNQVFQNLQNQNAPTGWTSVPI